MAPEPAEKGGEAREGAEDEIERQLDAGESLSVEAFRDWEPTVPKAWWA